MTLSMRQQMLSMRKKKHKQTPTKFNFRILLKELHKLILNGRTKFMHASLLPNKQIMLWKKKMNQGSNPKKSKI